MSPTDSSRSATDFSGVYTALITPFLKGEVDWTSLKMLVRSQIDGGITGVVVSGTTGESPTVTMAEKKRIFEFIRSESDGALKLVMGTGSNSTAETIAATKAAKEWGAAGALVVVPYYNKPSQRGLFEHFAKVATESELPIILYNVPGRTITRLELSTIQELSKVKGIVAIKDATGDIEFGRAIALTTNLLLSSGDDGTCLMLAGAGGRGVISVISHLIPKDFSSWMKRATSGESEVCSREFASRFGALNEALYVEANPIPLKYALYKMGIIASPELRLPLTELDEKYRAKMDQLLKQGGLA
jgi:4-hydroxy-tetrahydrodipicolinate synthase